jgi:DNA polymerase III epsilon subunit-like protein
MDYKMRLQNRLIYVLDLETDSVDYRYCNILEIGISAVDLQFNVIFPVLDVIIKPDMCVSDNCWVFQNSNPPLSNEILHKEGISLKEVAPFLQKFLDEFTITSFNQDFDLRVLENCGFTISKRYYDPMVVLTYIMKIPHEYYGLKWPSMVEAYHFLFGEWIREPHRALLDSLLEARIILKMYRRGYFNKNV